MLSRAACGLAIRWISRAAIGLLSEVLDPPRITESRHFCESNDDYGKLADIFVSFRFVFVIHGKVQPGVLKITFKNLPELRRDVLTISTRSD